MDSRIALEEAFLGRVRPLETPDPLVPLSGPLRSFCFQKASHRHGLYKL